MKRIFILAGLTRHPLQKTVMAGLTRHPILCLCFCFCALNLQAQDLFLTSIAPKQALINPDRGFHLESIYQVTNEAGRIVNPYGRGAGQGQVGEEVYPNGFMDTRNADFKSTTDNITLTQLYIYLTAFWNTDAISKNGLDNIQLLFDGLREKHVKAILRFTYSRDDGAIGDGHTGANPGYERTMKHLAQLKPLIQNNMDVIAVVETGLIGTWGEWTPGYSTDQNNNIAKTLFGYLPEGYNMLVRYNSIKDNLKSVLTTDQLTRIGFANDYFTTGLKNCGSSDYCMDDASYNRVKDESFTFYMRGEIPYNEGPPWGFDILMEPARVLKVMKEHHYTALDITQNFTDNVTHWKTVKIAPDFLRTNNIFFDENYFKDETGKIVPLPLYQFIRDHLGYRLNVLPTSTVKGENGNLVYNIQLTNTGFATVLNPKPVYLVLIGSNNQIAKEIPLTNVNPKDWQPFAKGAATQLLTHAITGSVAAGVPSGTYKVGIWIPDSQAKVKNDPAYNIKFSLDNGVVTHWKDATHTVNIIGNITI